MANSKYLACDDEDRLKSLKGHLTLDGIDYVEVSAESLAEQCKIKVYFINSLHLDELASHPELFSIKGGVRVQNIRVIHVTKVDEHLEVEVDRPGDFSTYTLVIESGLLDPAYARCDFSFKAGCPSRFDCKPLLVCLPEQHTEPLIDYMAKDYASFRQALLDLIPTLVPNWKERLEADLGITLVELLSYVADHLSYYQDAVANEKCLEYARQRVSVRRHARLIDYRMHDGASARAFIHFSVNSTGSLPAGTQVLTRIAVPLGAQGPPHKPVIQADLKERALAVAGVVFETVGETSVQSSLNHVKIHAWGNRDCCLPRGTTTVDLEIREETSGLKPGDFLLFEEVKGSETGLGADADLTHRQVVRLTKVEPTQDLLLNKDLTRISWDVADKLAFPICLSVKLPDGTYVEDVSVARGNLVLADHGCTIEAEKRSGPRKPIHLSLRRAHRVRLNDGPLSFRIPLPDDNGSLAPAKNLWLLDPRKAEPQVTRLAVIQNGTVQPNNWVPVRDLLDSGPFDPHFVVETENYGNAVIRFAFGGFGMAPQDDTELLVAYRVGVGRAGNVGAETLVHVINPDASAEWPDIDSVRNPLEAWGGIDPEGLEQVKQLAPAAFHAEQLRAVTEEDYARAAEKHKEISRAVATFRWTGSWHTVFITIDPVGRTEVSPELERRVKDWVTRYTQAGYDLEIDPPSYVPLEIEVNVCTSPDHFRADVLEALLVDLSSRPLPDGRRGFFHPDNFTFGEALYLSQLYAAIESVEGVDSAEVTIFQRLGKATDNELEQGYIPMGRLEIARLDNDPNFPDNGILRLNMMGGK